MVRFRAKEVARRLLTGGILMTVIVTTFLPGWITQAASTPALADASSEAYTAENNVVDRPLASQRELAPMNALILSEPGSVEALRQAITEAGGYVYLRQGDALFVGLDSLNYQDLAPVGARAVFQGVVPENTLADLPADDRDAVETWNHLAAPELSASDDLANNGHQDLLVIPESRGVSPASVDYSPTNADTSVFMSGSVNVEVVFVESTKTIENWTKDEISKVKGEISSALNWWSVAPTAPDNIGVLRPSAQLTWNVNYHSPFEDNKVMVGIEPITRSLDYAYGEGDWISQIAATYANGEQEGYEVITWADQARDAAKTDWGFILYVVDSSADTDGKFADGMIAAAPPNGPWAIVASEGMSGGLSNLEIIIAKMVGHVFGAGDETYSDPENPGVTLCSDEEYYGYLHIQHSNCKASNQAQSLMRSGSDMISAYRNFQLSDAAREQVGWRDNDGNGVYDVMDTLTDDSASLYESGDRFVCPNMHISNVTIANQPATPLDWDGSDTWKSRVYNPSLNIIQDGITFHRTNINYAGYVWGRINDGDWIGAKPQGLAWDKSNEGYNLVLPGTPGVANNDIDIIIMNRWEQEVYVTSIIDLAIASAWSSPTRGENLDTNAVEFFGANGSQPGWSGLDNDEPAAYTDEIGAEACFSFQGSEVTIWHTASLAGGGKANVFVDGKLNSTIDYLNDDTSNHVISNLSDDIHTVQLIASGAGVVDFDAFEITNSSTGNVIFGKVVAPNPADTDSAGYYEQNGVKLQFIGLWNPVTWNSLPRQGTADNAGKSSSRPLDRIYAYFTEADTVAIYRRVYPGGGSADVYLNGEYRGTMQNHATRSMITPYYISGLSGGGTYTLEIRINNTGDKKLVFDALRLLNLSGSLVSPYKVAAGEPSKTIPARSVQERYGAWTVTNQYTQSDDQGDVVNVYFQASAITIRRDTGADYRQMEVYVDGVLRLRLNNAGKAATSVPSTIHGLDPAYPHVLQIRLTYTKPTKAALNRIRGYSVHYYPPLEQAGAYEEYQYDSGTGKKTWSNFVYDGTWAEPTSVSGPSDKHFVESKGTNARAFLYFKGVDSLSLYGVVGSKYGAADIYINGVFQSRFTQQSSATGYMRYVTLTGFSKTTLNILEIRVNTTVANIPRVISLDRVVLYDKPILQAPHQTSPNVAKFDNDGTTTVAGSSILVPWLQFSGQWKRVGDSRAYEGSMHAVQSRQDFVAFTVSQASRVIVYRKLASTYGMADVYVDGKLYTSFNNYSSVASGMYKQPFEIIGLNAKYNHEIVIKPRFSGSKFAKFDIDYIEVSSQHLPTVLSDGFYEQNHASTAIQYIGSSWLKPSGKDTYSVTRPGDRAMVLFDGNAFTTYYHRAASGGKFDLYIDGVLRKRVSSLATASVPDVPVSVTGLTNSMHTAEIVVVSGTVYIDAYRVFEYGAIGGPNTFVLKDTAESVVYSGQWTISGNYLRAREAGASISIYARNADTLKITREAKAGTFDVFVNGVKKTTAGSYVTTLGKPTEVFVVSGLTPMLSESTWIEIRTRSATLVSLSLLEIETLTPKMGANCGFEAESPNQGRLSGYWRKRASASLYGGYHMLSQSTLASYYISVIGIDYLIAYRSLASTYGSANIYIDGVFWGTMPNYATKTAYKVPFVIGPLTSGDTDSHVIEFRQASTTPFGLDRFECVDPVALGRGYYENNSKTLTNSAAYLGTWASKAVTNASGGAVHQSSQVGARVMVKFEGNKLTIYRTTTTDGKTMTATVDGTPYPINNRSATTRYRVPYTILLPENTVHSLELMVNSGVVNFDALDVGIAVPAAFGAYQEDTPQVAVNDMVNSWIPTSSAVHSEGSHVVTSQKNANVMFYFYGQRVTTYMTQGRNWGKVHFFLDGRPLSVVNLYARSADKPFYAYDIKGLTRGNHVLELRFEGAYSAAGKPRANVDVFSVDGAPVPRPAQVLPPADPDTGGDDGGDDGIPTEGCFEEAREEWVLIGDWFYFPAEGASGFKNPDVPGWIAGVYAYAAGDPLLDPPDEVYAQFRFKAEGFGLLYHTDPNGGLVDIYLDSMDNPLYENFSMYSAEDLFLEEALLSEPDLDPTVIHVLRVQYSGTGVGSGNQFYIDRIDLPAYDPIYNDNCQAQ